MVYIQSANHIQVVNNKVTSNVNKKTEKLVSLLLPTTIFSGVVNRRAYLRDVILTNFTFTHDLADAQLVKIVKDFLLP